MVSGKKNLDDFICTIEARFRISKAIVAGPIRFNGCTIRREPNGDIFLSMTEYAKPIEYLQITRERRKKSEDKVTKKEGTEFKSLAGATVWLEGGVSPY